MGKKKLGKETCPQCGTHLRGRTSCPRGPVCEMLRKNDEELDKRIAALDGRSRPRA